jgi:hypothetical protein
MPEPRPLRPLVEVRRISAHLYQEPFTFVQERRRSKWHVIDATGKHVALVWGLANAADAAYGTTTLRVERTDAPEAGA